MIFLCYGGVDSDTRYQAGADDDAGDAFAVPFKGLTSIMAILVEAIGNIYAWVSVYRRTEWQNATVGAIPTHNTFRFKRL